MSAATLVGCFSFGRGVGDIDRTPIVNTGAGATILMPGESPPMPGEPRRPGAPGQGPPGQGAPGQAPPERGSGASTQSGSGSTTSSSGEPGRWTGQSSHVPAGTGNITMIGGAQQDEQRHVEYREEPIWYKYVALPFALAAAPFKAAAEAMRDDREPGPEVPRATTAPARPVRAQALPDYESSQLQDLARELEDRETQQAGATGAPATRTAAVTPGAGSRPRFSIAEELDAMQRTPVSTPAPRTTAPPTPSTPNASVLRTPGNVTSPAPADGIIDRDGDGHIDHWIYREQGEIVRETFDENADGRPDRGIVYDPQSHRVSSIEEDANHDGSPDSWTDYRDGSVIRRRADADGDGQVDTWSFYSNGEITRHERDTTADGFRNRVGFYRGGLLEREELDEDADGSTDAILYYDDRGRVTRKEEDRNGDGAIDLISHYESGKLARRELLDPSALGGSRSGSSER